MKKIVSDYSREGDIVCDPCAGGATTLLAAGELGRHAVGAECDRNTYVKALDRLRLAVNQQSLFAPAQVLVQDDLPW